MNKTLNPAMHRCNVCESATTLHCANEQCTWLRCTNARDCAAYGTPGRMIRLHPA